jgi:cation diffusion facilitator CzcD-associated flavoprotein CzcO
MMIDNDVEEPDAATTDVAVIGAGFGGIVAALELKKAGRNFVVFERAEQPGGVWRDNIYPGCACDIQSHLYSIETEPNPDWTTYFASQVEILQYLKDVVRRNGLLRHIRLGVEIASAQFLETEGCWQLTDRNGHDYKARSLIVAIGSHNRPWKPAFPGEKRFSGELFHSSAWNPSVRLDGKRVAVIGTGASAVQIVPRIATSVAQLTVFQRTPAWVLPRGDRATSRFERWLFRQLPYSQKLLRDLIYWVLELSGLAFHGNDPINRILTRVALRKLSREVPDAATREKLTPPYKLGCKRVVLSDDFLPAFNRPNVTLVTDGIVEITANGLATADGTHHQADVIVMATGFVVTEMDGYLDIFGRDGRSLNDEWTAHGMQAFLGIHVEGYPNLALLMGPNSGLGHSSVIHVMESQMRYIMSWLKSLDKLDGGACFDVKPERQHDYNKSLQTRLAKTVWASGCNSWYLDRKGRNSTVYPGLTYRYRKATAVFRPDDYNLVLPFTSIAEDSARKPGSRTEEARFRKQVSQGSTPTEVGP